jgi:hypothetical protein
MSQEAECRGSMTRFQSTLPKTAVKPWSVCISDASTEDCRAWSEGPCHIWAWYEFFRRRIDQTHCPRSQILKDEWSATHSSMDQQFPEALQKRKTQVWSPHHIMTANHSQRSYMFVGTFLWNTTSNRVKKVIGDDSVNKLAEQDSTLKKIFNPAHARFRFFWVAQMKDWALSHKNQLREPYPPPQSLSSRCQSQVPTQGLITPS